jgi:hypothetical protein
MTNFNFIPDSHTRSLIEHGCTAVSHLDLWDWLKNFPHGDDEGFMLTTHPNVFRIIEKMESFTNQPTYSRSSIAFTMRTLEFIAKKGIHEYKKNYKNM